MQVEFRASYILRLSRLARASKHLCALEKTNQVILLNETKKMDESLDQILYTGTDMEQNGSTLLWYIQFLFLVLCQVC